MEALNVVWNAVQHNGAAAAVIAYGLGLASANIPLIVQKFVQFGPVSKLIRKNPAIAKEIVAELQKDVDAVADAPAGKPTP